MNKIIITRLTIDILMTALFLLLLEPKNTGQAIHEIAGLAIGVLVACHIMLNWPWVKSVTKNLFSPSLRTKPKLFYVLNALSFIGVMTIITTGILISRVLFPSSTPAAHSLVSVHKLVSYSCLALFGVHITLHRRFILEATRKLVAPLTSSRLGKAVLGLAAVVLIAGTLLSQNASNASKAADKVITKREPPAHHGENYHDKERPGCSSSQSNQSNAISADPGDNGAAVSIDDFLGKMFCNGCDKHCSLLSLQCDKGTPQLQAAQAQYQQTYGSANLAMDRL